MRPSIFATIDATVLCVALFAGCVLMVMLGKTVRHKLLKDEQESKGGVNSLLGALFGLWGFILAFTFGNSASRFENIRAMMVDEANVIRTAILRSETFRDDSIRNEFRGDLKKYLEARIGYYEYAADADKFNGAKQDAIDIGKRLWNKTIDASQVPNLSFSANTMMSVLTNMFDIAAKRDALLSSGIPVLVSAMLFFLALTISFVGGFTTPILKTKEWVVVAGFILLACTIIYITMDLARPMTGFIKPDVGQDRIVQLRTLF